MLEPCSLVQDFCIQRTMVEGGFSSVSACNLDLVADWYLAFIHACASPYNSNYVGIHVFS